MARKSLNKVHSNKTVLLLSLMFFCILLTGIGTTVYFKVSNARFCANTISCLSNLSGQKEDATTGVFMGKTITVPQEPKTPVFALVNMKQVLGTNSKQHHIYVDLTEQTLYAYEGNSLAFTFPISSGKWNKTPTGDFSIWIWLRYTRMAGGSVQKGDYYNLPNVPYTMYFSNQYIPRSDGYSIHGAYWHNNFGHPMSHGCVNMKPDDAKQIFYWTNPTVKYVSYVTPEANITPITIYGTTPLE